MTKAQIALNALSRGEFQKAFDFLNQAIQKDPSNLKAKMGFLLWDIAQSDSHKALGLLEFYYALLFELTPQKAQEQIINLINSMDQKDNQETEQLFASLAQNSESFSCISYEDFKNFVFTKSNFKEAFEDFALSTKIIFSHKEEVYEFLNFLIDKGRADLSIQYAENISETTGFDLQLNQILQKAFKHLK
ncbi:hypothetical protein [Helicobacter pametensis]|uniref:hypothetical protein n=1 Tax=Helicobacter pametensis TaxID=95149 RepID=UPI000482E2F7|nr:hypothetical protein [Helicobacter pametensis]